MRKAVEILLCVVSLLLLTSCNKTPKEKIFATFYYEDGNTKECEIINKTINCKVEEPKKEGYTFIGWFDETDNKIDLNTQFEKSMILYAKFEKGNETYLLSFDGNGVDLELKDILIGYEEELPTLENIPKRDNYTFMGWYDGPNYEESIKYYDELNKPVKTFDKKENLILYAGWKISDSLLTGDDTPDSSTNTNTKYVISFCPNRGKGGQSTIKSVSFGEPLPEILKEKPVRNGYEFMGWYDGPDYRKDKQYYNSSNTAVIKTYDRKSYVTLYAGWKSIDEEQEPIPEASSNTTPEVSSHEPQIVEYEISFNTNGGSGGQSSSKKVQYNESLPSITSVKPVRSGYEFQGWYDNPDYTKGTAYYNKDGAALINYKRKENVTLYAGWKTNTYTITFDANGGTGAPSEKNVTYNESLPSIGNIPTREGYTFLGWYDSKTDGTQYYNELNVPVVKKYTKTSNIILYARWRENILSIRYNGNGGKWNSSDKTYSVNIDGTVIVKSTNEIYEQKLKYEEKLGASGLVDCNGTIFNWEKSEYYVVNGKEYIISKTVLNQNTQYTAKKLSEYGGCDLSKKDCTITVKVNWKKGTTIRVGTYNIGNFRCGTSGLGCSSNPSKSEKHADAIKKNNIDIIGIQEANTINKVREIKELAGFTEEDHESPAATNMTLLKYTFESRASIPLVSCREARVLLKNVLNFNGVDVSFYNTHFSSGKNGKGESCQLIHMADAINKIKDDPNPIILVGDFNWGRKRFYTDYVKPYGFEVAAHDYPIEAEAAEGEPCGVGYSDAIYILSRGHINIVDSGVEITRGIISDHNIVYADLEIH